jgi:hypothetical protein
MTGRKLITDTLRMIEVTAQGEDPEAEEAIDALDRLNEMMDSWNAQKLALHATAISEYNLVAAQQVYELGPTAADFVQQRPSWLTKAGIVTNNNPVQPLVLPMRILTNAEWLHQVPVKNITSRIPTKLYVEWTHPNARLHFWPIPDDSTVQVRLYYDVQLTPWPDLDTDLQFPVGYAEAIRYNLGVRLCPEFGRKPSEIVAGMADHTFATVKSTNLANHQQTLAVDPELTGEGGHYDWRVDEGINR